MSTKSQQLQIRVSPQEKAALKRLARSAGQDVSTYVLARVLPEGRGRVGQIVRSMRDGSDNRLVLAELNDLLTPLTPAALSHAVSIEPSGFRGLLPLHQNYVAAMVEHACHRRDVAPPSWVHEVAPIETPYFATRLQSLRLHLIRASPVAFKRRNIFVDSSLGDRV